MSVVNGDANDETTAIKKTNDGLQSDSSSESKSSLKNDKVESDTLSKLQKSSSSESSPSETMKSVKENVEECIDLAMEEDEEIALISKPNITEESEKVIKPIIVENGTHCSNSVKDENPCNSSDNDDIKECDDKSSNNSKELKTDEISPQSSNLNSIDTSVDEKLNEIKIVDSTIENSTADPKSSKDQISSIEGPNECSSKAGNGSDAVVSEEDLSEDLVILDEVSNDKPNQCDNNSDIVDKKLPTEKLDHSTENKVVNFTSNGTLDLSVSKNKETDIQLLNSNSVKLNENSKNEPLEKLNEHLNSIGVDGNLKSMQNIAQKDSSFTLNTQKVDYQSNNKENKAISSNTHDRFKESPDNFVFAELSNEETGFPEIFTGMVKIGRYISVKGDFTLRSTEALVESPSLVSSYLLKEPDTFPSNEKDTKSESKDFFHSTAGEILIGIGLSRVNEWFHKDMVRIKKRQLKNSKTVESKRPQLEEELAEHEKNFVEAKKANNVYSCKYKVCKVCGFTTESLVVMEGHKLVPHVTSRREYQCNFCDKIDRDPKAMLDHMEKEHQKNGRIQPPVLFFECPYCTFESNSKVKLNNHLAKCQRYFDHGVNQAPPRDFEFPALTPKPITVAVVKAYEKSLGTMQRGRGRPKKQDNLDSMHMNQFSPNVGHSPATPNNLMNYRSNSGSPLIDTLSIQNQIMSPIQMPNMNIRPSLTNSISQIRPVVPPLQLQAPNRFYQVVNTAGQVVPVVGGSITSVSSQFPFPSNIANSGKKMPASGAPLYFGGIRQQNTSKNMPEMSITALPKLTGPYPSPMAKPGTQPGNLSMSSNSLVVCEICDGYIKDLDQLRTHMQLIHKVKIHPKMLVSRPPLNCQKCQWRFFTDQGLERHLLGAHGLVTSNMQELANKSKDAGCCTICGRVYASKLVSHMNQVHKITLKPAHLSYKCTVCSATFNLYRLFENHVYLVHSGAAKRSSEGGRSSPSKRLRTHSDKGVNFIDSEPRNHKQKTTNDDEEEVRICVECGDDVFSKKPDCKKCEKCLKSDELVKGTLSTKI